MNRFTVNGELTDLNTYINAERANKFMASKIKKEETERVANELAAQGVKPVTEKRDFVYTWYCQNKRKDKDNISFAKKFILDGLVMSGVIPNDGWNWVGSDTSIYIVDKKRPRVEVSMI